MNSSVYIFGKMQNGYTQYPDNETTHEIFQNFALNAKAPTQLAIHRDGSLMYYGYIRKLEDDQYIGLCVLLNSRMFDNATTIFSLFELTIEKLVEYGYLIKFDMTGKLIANTQHLYMSKSEVDIVSIWLQQQINSLETNTSAIPPVNYAIAGNTVQVFSHTDDAKIIFESSYSNGYTYVLKAEDYNTVNFNSYQAVVSSQAQQIAALTQQVQHLQSQSQYSTTPNPTLGIGEAYNLFWKNFANFEGRSRRSEYWWPSLVNAIILIILYLIVIAGYATGSNSHSSSTPPLAIFGIVLVIGYFLATFIPNWSLSVRRLHDAGYSGWWLVLNLIPFVNYVGWIAILVFTCEDSKPGTNKWGTSPKYNPKTIEDSINH